MDHKSAFVYNGEIYNIDEIDGKVSQYKFNSDTLFLKSYSKDIKI